MQHIKAILNKRVRETGLAKDIKNSLVIEEFSYLVSKNLGDKILQRVKPLYVKNKVLSVACLSSVVAQEVSLNKVRIISQINKKFQSHVINDIKLVI
jgi:hypothetical protein